MKKIKKFIQKHSKTANAMASMALLFSVVAANSRCYYIFHQPEAPEGLSELRKF